MLNISLQETDLTINIVTECIHLHSDLLDIYEDVSECVHYSYMCESSSSISVGVERLKTGIREIFTRLKNFIKTVTDKLLSLFVKKSRVSNVKKDKLRKLIESGYINIEPFRISTYNFSFTDNLDYLFHVSYTESNKITSRINDILNIGEDEKLYSSINDLKLDMVSEDYFNLLRRYIINSFRNDRGNNVPVSKNQFIPELELVLRGGTTTKTEIEVTKTLLYEIIKSDDEQMKIRKNLETYKNKMISMFTTLENDFNTAVKVISDKSWRVDATVNRPLKNSDDIRVFDKYEFNYSQKILATLNDLFSSSIVYFKNLSDIISIALSEYSKAVVESMEINDEIFSIALTKIEREM